MRFLVEEGEPYAVDSQGKVPALRIARQLPDGVTNCVALIVGVPSPGLNRDDALTRIYAATMADALQREFGTPEPVATDVASFAGIAIPPALDEIKAILQIADRTEPIKRTKHMVDAIVRFCQWADAEGIPMQRAEEPVSNADVGRDLANETRPKLWDAPEAGRAKVGPTKGPGDE